MKKQLIFGSLLAFAGIANAQNTFPTPSGNVGIGTTSPSMPLHVVASPTGQNGILVKQATIGSSAQGAAIHLDNTVNTGGKRYSLISTGPGDGGGAGNFLIYDWFGGNYRFVLNGATGNIGIGGNTNPAYKLDILANTSGDDGIKISQASSSYRSALYLHNTAGSGNNWALTSNGGGHLNVRNETSGLDFLDMDANGHIGINTVGVASTQLLIQTAAQGIYVASSNAGNAVGIEGTGVTSAGNANFSAGIKGAAQGGGTAYGVKGYAYGASTAYGGYFSATPYAACGTPGYQTIGVYAGVTSPCLGDLAGMFDGDVYINGSAFSGIGYASSDRKLKKDIKPFTNGMEKIKLLKPSTYTFRTDEFKGMNLPNTQQLGLIAQELEEVFPGLVAEAPAHDQRDKDGNITATTPSHKAINYIGLIPVLIAGIQEQQQTIDQQTAINADLQKQLDEQKALITSLTQKASGTTGINNIGGVETGFQMSQNEPNPFTHETVVKYTLPQTVASAFMAVYDLTGKQIATFPIQEKGSSSLTITSEKLSAGIYIYSIVADGNVIDSKRMIVAGK